PYWKPVRVVRSVRSSDSARRLADPDAQTNLGRGLPGFPRSMHAAAARGRPAHGKLLRMILIGQYDSPFVRRVAIALTLYDLPFEHRPWSVFGDADKVRTYNPLVRVPIL